MVEEIKGLEKCIWKYMSNDRDSTTFLPVNEDYPLKDKEGSLWKCKFNCSGFNDTEPCYKPLYNYSESKYYKLVLDDYYALKKINERPVLKW